MTAPHQNLLGTSGAVDTEETDPNFNETILLLHGDGTNGGQNNTFVDSSSTGHTISRDGNVTQGTFNPFLGDGYYSTFFTGTSGNDGLRTTGTNDSPFATNLSTFSIEAWIYMTSDPEGSSSHSGLVGMNVKTDHNNHLSWGPTTNRKLQLFWYSGGNNTCTGSTTLELNRWYFISLVVNSNAISMQVDGVAETLTGTTTLTNRTSQQNFIIGRNGQTRFNGYTTNIRISDIARTITVPSTPLTADSDTLFLYCGDNRFKDPADGTESVSFDSFGGKVVPFSPYAPTASYSESVHGGSALFDGNDQLEITDHSDFTFGSNNLSIGVWVYRIDTTASTERAIAETGGNSYTSWLFTTKKFWATTDGSSWNIKINYSQDVPVHQWVYVQVNRVGNVYTAYHNGVSVGTVTIAGSLYDANTTFRLGYRNGAGHFDGYMSNFIMTNDGNLASTDVPTSPITADSNTKLLLNFTNAEIIDSTMKNNLETVDNAQIDTSIKKFGTGSIQFDGSGDYLTGTNQPYITIGYSSYTFECFVYITTGVQTYHGLLSIVGGIQFQLSNELMRLSSASAQILIADGGDEVALNTWTHLAFVKDSSTDSLKFFKDGTLIKSGTDATNWNHTGALQVGRIFNSSTYDIEGYIDEARLTLAPRYSSSFTAPTKSHPNK